MTTLDGERFGGLVEAVHHVQARHVGSGHSELWCLVSESEWTRPAAIAIPRLPDQGYEPSARRWGAQGLMVAFNGGA